MNMPTREAENEELIVCRVTRWYYRRMGLAALMCLVFGLYFLYDWKVGYPKANGIADQQDWFEKELLPSYDVAKKNGTLGEWMERAKENGWPTGKEGEPPKWLQYAAMKGWPEKPKRHTQKEVDEQLWWGLGTISISLVVMVMVLLNRNKVLRGGEGYLVTPDGQTVAFSDVFRVDKRKWDNKGLAYVWHRKDAGGRDKKAVIDDLKYGGADKVLERLLAGFRGELIEKVVDVEPEGQEEVESK